MTEKDLLDIKSQIEEAKTQVSELKGTEKHLMKTLKEEWGCADLPEARKALQNLADDIEKLNTKIQAGLEELEKQYSILSE